MDQKWIENGTEMYSKCIRKAVIKNSEEFSKFELFMSKINYRLSPLLISCGIKRITEMTKKIIPLDFIIFIVELF